MELFNKEEQETIKNAIKTAERKTSGELRICVEKHCPEFVLDRAAYFFDKLDMQKTEARNGVLIYLAVADRQMAIIGDGGINAVVPDNFWDNTKEAMIALFKESKMAEGLIKGIELAGEALGNYFPFQKNDINELPDDIVFGDTDEKDKTR